MSSAPVSTFIMQERKSQMTQKGNKLKTDQVIFKQSKLHMELILTEQSEGLKDQ